MADENVNIVITAQDKAQEALSGVNKNINGVKATAVAATAVFAATVAGIASSVGAYNEFNDEIERAGAFISASEKEMQKFRDTSISAVKGTTYSATEAAAALGNFVGGEIDAATAAAELGGVIDLAIIGKMGDLQKAVNVSSLALTVFKDDNMESSDVLDIFATVAADVTTQTDAWSTALVNSAGAAKASGLSFEDLNVMFASMVRGGANVNLTWSALNSALVNIQSPSEKVKDALLNVELSAEGMKDALGGGSIELLEYLKLGFDRASESGDGFVFLTEILGRQAAPEFALALGLTNEELQEVGGYFEDITGRGQEMVDRLKESTSATEILGQQMSELRLRVGQALSPVIENLTKLLIPLVEKVIEWVVENPKLTGGLLLAIAAISGIIAVGAGLVLLLPTITTLFGALWLAITGPVGIVITSVLALGTAVYLIWENWDWLSQRFGEFWETFKTNLADMWAQWDEKWLWIKTALEAAWEVISSIFDLFVIGIQFFARQIAIAAEGWAIAWDWMERKVNSVISAISPRIKTFSGLLSGLSLGFEKAIKGSDSVNKRIFEERQAEFSPTRAFGGSVSSGMPHLVGENGPEIFYPSSKGTIGQVGAGGIHITINGDVSGESIAEKIGDLIVGRLQLHTSVLST